MWPMAIATPTIAALFGTAWAVSHPAFVTVRPRLVVPVRQSLGDVLVTALFWGAIGVGAVMSSVFLMALAWYRLSGDRVWLAGE